MRATAGPARTPTTWCTLCDVIAEELGVHGPPRAELLAAAQLHDIGKVGIPRAVLDKPGPLDESEWALIKEHTTSGERIVRSVPELLDVARLVRHSHERWDGDGYPDGLSGHEIPLGSRIVFCADAFHAIRSDRPYRRGRSAREALEEVKRGAGSQFDPEVVDALVRSASKMRTTVRAGARGLATTLRSRRLVSLLLTLAIGGSALAANDAFLENDDKPGDERSAQPTGAAGDAQGGSGVGAAAWGKPGPIGGGESEGGRPGAGDTETGGSASGSSKANRGRVRRARRSSGSTPSGPPAQVPRRRRVGRPASPGRSLEAPGRPAQPGRPIGGAPGRSEEAPRRPAQPVTPPAKRVNPQAVAPRAAPPAGAKGR